ncbi:NAD-binding protein [Phellopilus nigrolimitatus]|nr:NAD-binding protein [Phellopilus nigrolimitatus]
MGQYGSILSNFLYESFPPEPKFSAADVPDLTGKVIIVTGGNSGVGKETIKTLLTKNAKVYMACRSKEKADAAITELMKDTGKTAHFLELDLANLRAVKKAAETFSSQEKELHILYNNGGVMWTPIEMLTEDGYDVQFGTNVLGHFYFTKLLLPLLLETAKSAPDGKARVITVSSVTRHGVSKIEYDTIKDGPKRQKMGYRILYYQSKFANAVFSRELARRYGDQGIVAIACNPGNLRTNLMQHANSLDKFLIDKLLLYDVSYGALTQLWAGTSPEAKDHNGAFFIPWAGEELWNWLEGQVKGI